MFALLSLAALTAVVSASDSATGYTVKPCFEGTCDKCSGDYYNVTTGVPDVKIYDEFTQKGYNSSATAGGYNVWWDISQPDEGCAILIYKDYSQGESTANWGNVVLEASRAGCFYTSMTGGQWATQFCCGSGDCGQVQPGDFITQAKGKSSKREASTPEDRLAGGHLVEPVGTATAPLKNSTETGTKKSSTTESAAPANPIGKRSAKFRRGDRSDLCQNGDLQKIFSCTDKEWAPEVTCKNVHKVKEYSKAAKQEQVTSAYLCGSAQTCAISHGTSVTLTNTVTNQHAVTNTQSNGMTITLEAGLELTDAFKIGGSASYSHEWSKAVMDSTSTSDATSYSTTNTWAYNQVPGTYGFLTFTGSMNCAMFEMDCMGSKLQVEKCDPSLLSGSKEPQGDTLFVTVGQ